MTRVLVTGFEPFGGDDVNPSWEAVSRLTVPQVQIRQLPCVYGAALEVLWAAVEELDPEVVVCVGLAGGRARVELERVGVNLDDAPMADNAGGYPVDRPIVPGGPAAYFATIPTRDCVDALRAAGVPAGLSYSAGTFVCNHVLYGVLHRAATLRPGLRAGFVHVPYLPGQGTPALPLESTVGALRAIVDVALAAGTDHRDV
jgi:pyroglutamyl-peptidase